MTKAQANKKMSKAGLKKLLAEVQQTVTIPKEEEQYALAYIEGLHQDFHIDEIINGIMDGAHMDNIETIDLGDGLALQKSKEQEFIDVDQDQVKKSLMTLMTKENDFLGMLYTKWDEYNEQYFLGALPHPLISIGKMDNRTLSTYTIEGDSMGIKNHISFNRNFVALNTNERILESLRHEMIHQWQDEVLYQGVKDKKPRMVSIKVVTEDGEVVIEEIEQKKRPKEWHNKDFKDCAKVVGIKADGANCTGNPAKMPVPESYNRKFVCGCVASNGYRLTVWSTRQVNATCKTCKKDYVEIPKGGKLIRVEQSHVEKPGEDAIETMFKGRYSEFKRFKTKELKDAFLEGSTAIVTGSEGVYQKNHNMYKKGYTHWVAYNKDENGTLAPVDKPVVAKPKPAPPKPVAKPAPVEKPVATKPKPVPKTPAVKKPQKPATPKVEPVVEKPVPTVVEPAPVVEAPKKDSSEHSYKNAEDLLEVYREKGSIKGVAEYFGTVPGTIIYQAKKLGVDFKKGVVDNGAK